LKYGFWKLQAILRFLHMSATLRLSYLFYRRAASEWQTNQLPNQGGFTQQIGGYF